METLLVLALGLYGSCSEPPPLRLATTTSVKDSGLLDALLPAFKGATGIDVGVTAVGTGIALRLGERGEADALITHDVEREEAFVRERHALERAVFASSDFLVVGPSEDPAGIQGSSAAVAFRAIAASGRLFASRGDESGTHAREKLLWRAAGRQPADSAVVHVGAGMLTTLQFADERGAYTLTDRATYLAHRDRLRLEVLVEGDSLLRNDYAIMIVDPRRHPKADRRRAEIFARWLFSDEARRIISGLARGGEPLFRLPPRATSAR